MQLICILKRLSIYKIAAVALKADLVWVVAMRNKKNEEMLARAEAEINNQHQIKPSFSSLFQSENAFAYFLQLLEDQGLIDTIQTFIREWGSSNINKPANISGLF